jgi:hypothetical protein
VVVVTLHTDRKMYRDRLASTVVQQDVNKVIQQAAGREVKVEWRLPEIAGPTGAQPKPPASVEPGPLAKRVMGAFRGRVVQVNPEDRAPAPSEEVRREDDGAPVDEAPPDMQE